MVRDFQLSRDWKRPENLEGDPPLHGISKIDIPTGNRQHPHRADSKL